MEKSEALQLIIDVYELDEHRSSDKPDAISATTIIGSHYKAGLALEKREQDRSLVSYKLKRGSTLGTAFHAYAEHALADRKDIRQELYRERQIWFGDTEYTISGTCDVLRNNGDGTWTIMDWKTSIGKQRQGSNLEKDRLQMSIYRWLLSKDYKIEDRAFSLFVSTSNNEEEAYEIDLMSLTQTEEYIEDKLYAITSLTGMPDCKVGIRYDPCAYCSYICDYRNKL